jgi:hypothetical protein
MKDIIRNIKSVNFYKEEFIEIKNTILSNENEKENIINSFKKTYIEENIREDTLVNFDSTANFILIKFFEKSTSVFDFVVIKNKEGKIEITNKITQVNNLNNFEKFEECYNIYRKYILLFKSDNSILTNLLTSCKNNLKKSLQLRIDEKINRKNMFLSKNKVKISKISKIFPLNTNVNVENFIEEASKEKRPWLSREEEEKVNIHSFLTPKYESPEPQFKMNFLTLHFNKNGVLFEHINIKVINYKTEEQYFMYNSRIVELNVIKKLLNNSFSFRGKIIKSRTDLPFKVSQKGIITYDHITEELQMDMLKENINNF